MPKKLFEVKFGDWEKSLSYETTDFVNGIFRQFKNCNPFRGRGAFTPVGDLAELGSGTISTTLNIRAILPVYKSSGSPSGAGFYALADNYKLYFTDLATLQDVTSEIGTGTATAIDLAIWKNKLIYVMSGEVRSNAITVASGSDAQILSASPTSNFCVGPDRNGYIGISNNVGKLILETGTSGNTTSVAASLESGFVTKKLLSDGRYLVWLADNFTSQPSGRNTIVVAWWNLASSTFDQIWEFEGGQLCGAEIFGTRIKILTSTGIWFTNFSTKPFLVVPMDGSLASTDYPTTFTKTVGTHQGNIMFWGTTDSGGNIFGLGNKLGQQTDRLFQLHTSSQGRITAVASNNTNFLIASNTSGGSSVKLHSYVASNATLTTAIANVAGFSLGKPYTFHSARVVLKNPISSGNSVSLQILTSNSNKTILASSSKTNSSDPSERNLVFDHVAAGDGSDVRQFEDISDVKLTTNVPVHALTIYGEPVDERGSYG